jgi:hypothetical protein
MNRALVDGIANTVLYEGYILYPYRPSVKNRQRWTFGGLCPEAYCREHDGEASSHQTAVLVRGAVNTAVEVIVRFLRLTARTVEEKVSDGCFRPVESLSVDGRLFHTWQEAEEREIPLVTVTLGELQTRSLDHPFTLPGRRWTELIHGSSGEVVGALVRTQRDITGHIEARAVEVTEGLFRLTVRVANCTPAEGEAWAGRDEALLSSLVSAHTLLSVHAGEFVSLLDPPDDCREAACTCRNVGVWPVLVGNEGQSDTLLAAPIILYDYPRVAPESSGDFFDGTEIDEMLTLRILTLTDEEKRVMAAVDERARGLLERTAMKAREHLPVLHGTIRGLRPVQEESERG